MFKKTKSTPKTEEEIIEHFKQAAQEELRRRNQAKAAKTNFKDLFSEDSVDSTPKNQK